jgi:hypothetical protein
METRKGPKISEEISQFIRIYPSSKPELVESFIDKSLLSEKLSESILSEEEEGNFIVPNYTYDFSKRVYYTKTIPQTTRTKIEPLWCKNVQKMEKKKIEKFYKDRSLALDQLMDVQRLPSGKYMLNLDFINHYSDYFYINNECVCNKLFDEQGSNFFIVGKLLGKGKTGSVYLLLDTRTRDNQKPDIFVLKTISNVTLNSYLPLRLIIIDQATIKNDAFIVNEFKIRKKTSSSYLSYISGSKKESDYYCCLQCPTDNFTNQTLLHMILNRLLGDNPNYLYQYDSFYCSNEKTKTIEGYNITEYCNADDLSKYLNTIDSINEQILIDILKQVLTPLFVLKHPIFGFLHSDLKTKNIFVNNDNGLVTLKIADFDKSSIFYKNIRFFNNSFNYTLNGQIEGWNWKGTPFPLNKSKPYWYYNLGEGDLISKYVFFHEYIMSNPEGFYSSFDIYTFFYSLILEKPVMKWMFNNPENRIWDFYKYLFHGNEPDQWEKFLKDVQSHEEESSKTTSSIKFYWEQFKKNAYKLRYNVNDLYTALGININSVRNLFPSETIQMIQNNPKPNIDILYVSNDNHLCIVEPSPGDAECKTNVYSKKSKDPRDLLTSYIYNYDNL